VASHRDTVFSVALHFVGDEPAAADVTQTVFLKLLERVRQFRREAEFTTWLYRIVVNTCLSHRKLAERFVSLEDVASSPAFVAPASQETEVMRREQAAELRAAILALTPTLRLPVLLRYVAGLGYDDIGRVLGLPGGTVASRLGRAHRALEARLAHLRSPADGGIASS
jgi:RNA polymerase sigma-70 factor (ECF subfamily)